MTILSKHKRLGINIILLLSYLTIVIATFLTSKIPSMGKIGTYAWFIAYFIFAVLALHSLIQIIHFSIKKRTFFIITALVILFSLIIYNAPLLKSTSGETTIAVTCAINHLKKSPDLGFQQNCFLGYPARSYFLQAIPTLIAGRSLFNLNLGASLYFVIGILIFINQLIIHFKPTKKADVIAGITTVSLLHFHYFNHFLLYCFEQSIFPLSFGFLTIGLFLKFIKKRNSTNLLLIALCLQFLIYLYTPALALLGLGLIVLLFLLIKKFKLKYFIAGVLITILTLLTLTNSLKIRDDVRLYDKTNPEEQINSQEIKDTFEHFVFQNQGIAYNSTFINFVVIFTLTIALLVVFGYEFIFLSFWVIATIVIATNSRGYAFYGLDFRMHRSLVVVPIILAILAYSLHKVKIKKQLLLTIFFIILSITGYYYQDGYLSTKQITDHQILINHLTKNYQLNKRGGERKFYFIDSAFDNYISLWDRSQYYFPETKVKPIKSDNLNNLNINVRQPDIFIFQKNSAVGDFEQNLIKYGYEKSIFTDNTKNYRIYYSK